MHWRAARCKIEASAIPQGAGHHMKLESSFSPRVQCDPDAFYAMARPHKPVRGKKKNYLAPIRKSRRCDAVNPDGGFSYGDYLRTRRHRRAFPLYRNLSRKFATTAHGPGNLKPASDFMRSGLLPGAMMRKQRPELYLRHVHTGRPNGHALHQPRKGTDLKIPCALRRQYTIATKHRGRNSKECQFICAYTTPTVLDDAAIPTAPPQYRRSLTTCERNVAGLMHHPEPRRGTNLGSSDGLVILLHGRSAPSDAQRHACGQAATEIKVTPEMPLKMESLATRRAHSANHRPRPEHYRTRYFSVIGGAMLIQVVARFPTESACPSAENCRCRARRKRRRRLLSADRAGRASKIEYTIIQVYVSPFKGAHYRRSGNLREIVKRRRKPPLRSGAIF